MAQEACREPAGKFASIEGQVQVRGNEQQAWRAAKPVDRLCKGDTIRVGELSRAAVVLVNEAVIRLDQNTTMRLVDISGKKEDRSLIELAKGAIKSFIRKPRLLSVNTPYLNGSIEGTEFQVSVAENAASILVLEGRVLAPPTTRARSRSIPARSPRRRPAPRPHPASWSSRVMRCSGRSTIPRSRQPPLMRAVWRQASKP